jgi:FkbM family methyltransferase
MSLPVRINNVLAGRGYELRRHPAARRQQLLVAHNVDLVLDVGAATGAYGTELRAFGYRGLIVSFEPLNGAYAALRDAQRGDNRWRAVQTALGNEEGEIEINIAGNSDSSSMLPMLEATRKAAPHASYVGVQKVRVCRLDDVSAEYIGAATHPFLKMDTQGYEKQVLEGATMTIPKLVGIQIELSFIPLYEGSMLADEAIGHLYAQGFAIEGIEPGFRNPWTGQLLQADGLFVRQGTA